MIKYAGFLSSEAARMAAFLAEQEATHYQARSLGLSVEQVEAIETRVQRRAAASLRSSSDYWRVEWDYALLRLKQGVAPANVVTLMETEGW